MRSRRKAGWAWANRRGRRWLSLRQIRLLHFVGLALFLLALLVLLPVFLVFLWRLGPVLSRRSLAAGRLLCAKLTDAIPKDNSATNASVNSLFMSITSLPTVGAL